MPRVFVVLALVVGAAAGCGQGASGEGAGRGAPTTQRATAPPAAQFPATSGRALRDVAGAAEAGPRIGLATSVYTPGRNRLAFGLIGPDNAPMYGETSIYVARSPSARALGPFPATSDSLAVEAPFRSQTSAEEGPGAITSIFSATVPLERPGRYAVLALTRAGPRMLGATASVTVRRDSAVPRPGARAPAAETDTVASAGGALEAIDTRVPPDDMHRTSLKSALGRRPVALLFATPQLCQSRVCGPVVDIAAQLQRSYGDRMDFIHQEVYVDNDVNKGLRPPLRAFGLRTEPWLFTIRRDGRVAARLEGSFGVDEFRRAVEAALR